jgi:hypothetical protein
MSEKILKINQNDPTVLEYKAAFKRGFEGLSDEQKQLVLDSAKKSEIANIRNMKMVHKKFAFTRFINSVKSFFTAKTNS